MPTQRKFELNQAFDALDERRQKIILNFVKSQAKTVMAATVPRLKLVVSNAPIADGRPLQAGSKF